MTLSKIIDQLKHSDKSTVVEPFRRLVEAYGRGTVIAVSDTMTSGILAKGMHQIARSRFWHVVSRQRRWYLSHKCIMLMLSVVFSASLFPSSTLSQDVVAEDITVPSGPFKLLVGYTEGHKANKIFGYHDCVTRREGNMIVDSEFGYLRIKHLSELDAFIEDLREAKDYLKQAETTGLTREAKWNSFDGATIVVSNWARILVEGGQSCGASFDYENYEDEFDELISSLLYLRPFVFPESRDETSAKPSEKKNMDDRYDSAASAVVVDAKKGLLITNEHVVRRANQLQVVISGNRYKADIVTRDEKNDLAVLSVHDVPSGKLSGLSISTEGSLGQGVYSVGYPRISEMGYDVKVTEGVISSLTFLSDPSRYQISCPITNGNSGGALIDQNGNLLGITQGGYRPDANTENVNAAVKAWYVSGLLQTVNDYSPLPKSKGKIENFNGIEKSVLPLLVHH